MNSIPENTIKTDSSIRVPIPTQISSDSLKSFPNPIQLATTTAKIQDHDLQNLTQNSLPPSTPFSQEEAKIISDQCNPIIRKVLGSSAQVDLFICDDDMLASMLGAPAESRPQELASTPIQEAVPTRLLRARNLFGHEPSTGRFHLTRELAEHVENERKEGRSFFLRVRGEERVDLTTHDVPIRVLTDEEVGALHSVLRGAIIGILQARIDLLAQEQKKREEERDQVQRDEIVRGVIKAEVETKIRSPSQVYENNAEQLLKILLSTRIMEELIANEEIILDRNASKKAQERHVEQDRDASHDRVHQRLHKEAVEKEGIDRHSSPH